MSRYGVLFHISSIMLKNGFRCRGAAEGLLDAVSARLVPLCHFEPVYTVTVCAGRLWGHFIWFVRVICWNPRGPFQSSLPATLISCSSCLVTVDRAVRGRFTQLTARCRHEVVFCFSNTQRRMFSPSWPHYIISTNLCNNLTRNDAQTLKNPTAFGASPSIPPRHHPSAFCFPLSSFFHS